MCQSPRAAPHDSSCRNTRRHPVTGAASARAAAALGGAGEAAAAAVCHLRQVGRLLPGPSWQACWGLGVGSGNSKDRPTRFCDRQPQLPSATSPPLPQPKLRRVFEDVFECTTASGNNQVLPVLCCGAGAVSGESGRTSDS